MNERPFPIYSREAILEPGADGSLLVRMPDGLGPYPSRITERLEHWGAVAPDRPFLARRVGKDWRSVRYAEALEAARAIGAALLNRRMSAERPVLILSGNSIEQGLLSLACLHVGVPFVPISTAYSLVSTDFAKLRAIVALVRPGLIFADNGGRYAPAIRACAPADAEIVIMHGNLDRQATPFEALLAITPTTAVESAAGAVRAGTMAKLLFTSGSTGIPKAVIHTHEMFCSLQWMLQMVYPALAKEPPVLVDWLPWNHILGGSVVFGLALFNGGTLYIDDGKPVPGQIEETVRNLRDVAPLLYWNVPKGYEELIPHLRRDSALRESFFSRVRVLQYSGASIAQHVCDAIDELAVETVGERIPWVTILGSTEAGGISVYRHAHIAPAGNVGLPLPGVTLKLVPTDGKLEARVRSPSVTPGYWRQDDLTARAFDEEGFFRTGDGLDWIAPNDRQLGLRYCGRLAEDFKLATGTWVRVGALRALLLAHLAPDVRDVVIAGENRDYVAVLAVPEAPDTVNDDRVVARVRSKLTALAEGPHGSAQRVLRLAFLTGQLSIDAGDLTDKGGINQRHVLRRHSVLVEQLYADPPGRNVICVRPP